MRKADRTAVAVFGALLLVGAAILAPFVAREVLGAVLAQATLAFLVLWPAAQVVRLTLRRRR